MHCAEQYEIDFVKLEAERELFERWEANRAADAHNWTEEAMAMVWRFGMQDWEQWHQLPNYEREKTVNAYRFESSELDWRREHNLPRKRIRSYLEACPSVDPKVLDAMRRMADEMANQLSADWSANRPPSIFTYDSAIAAMVSCRLGRHIEAIKPGEGMVENEA